MTKPPGSLRVRHAGVLVALGVCLIATAVLKGHHLAYQGVPAVGLLTTIHSYALVVVAEYLLGVWLITGLYQQQARLVAMLYFWVFMEAALWLAMTGKESCGCLGQIAVNPWIMAAIDLAVLVGLVQIRPEGAAKTIQTHGLRFSGFVVVALALGVPGLLTMTVYRREPPKDLTYNLRHDRLLHNTKVVVGYEQSTANDLLALLAAKMGTSVTVDDAVRADFDACKLNWKAISHRTVRGWAVMESVAKGMPVRSRWITTNDGYVLIGDNPLRRAMPYWLAGVVLAVLGLWGIARARESHNVQLT